MFSFKQRLLVGWFVCFGLVLCFKQSQRCRCRVDRHRIKRHVPTTSTLPVSPGCHASPAPTTSCRPSLTMSCLRPVTRDSTWCPCVSDPEVQENQHCVVSLSNHRWVRVDKASSSHSPMDDLDVLIIQLPGHYCGGQLDNEFYQVSFLLSFLPLAPQLLLPWTVCPIN